MTKFRTHKHLKRPKGDDIIWRYFSLPKFVDLLYHSALFFSDIKKLPDYYEGRLSVWDKIAHEEYKEKDLEKIIKFYHVCSWTKSTKESNLLWYAYVGKGEPGIAIKTTVSKLENAIKPSNLQLYCTLIEYEELLGSLTPYKIISRKMPEYSAENEIRIIFNQAPDVHVEKRGGSLIEIDLDILIDKLYIYPSKPSWQNELIRNLLEPFVIYLKNQHKTVFKPPLKDRLMNSKIMER